MTGEQLRAVPSCSGQLGEAPSSSEGGPSVYDNFPGFWEAASKETVYSDPNRPGILNRPHITQVRTNPERL